MGLFEQVHYIWLASHRLEVDFEEVDITATCMTWTRARSIFCVSMVDNWQYLLLARANAARDERGS